MQSVTFGGHCAIDQGKIGIGYWGHFGKLSASLGTLRQAQCIAGDTSASSVHRWGLGTLRQAQCIAGDWGLGIGDWGLGIGDWGE
ncbi:MAG: hypothetical protein ACSI46_23075 [Gloeotrichia echinulata DVL01]|nr:hypothetical protein [Gloeotrichia echinulata DEX184]